MLKTKKEDKDLIKQLAKCSDKIKELEKKIAKKKKKISKLKSKNSYFNDIINNLVSENKYLNDKCKTLEASCIEAKLDIKGISESEHDLIVKCSELEKCMKVIKETLNKLNINNETKLSEIKKILS
jgi:phage shock protein A